MDMKSYLEGIVSRKEAEIDALVRRSDASQDVAEVRSIGVQVDALKSEIAEARSQIAGLDAAPTEAPATEQRFEPAKALGSFKQAASAASAEARAEGRGSEEYREAFRQYVLRGAQSPVLQRSDDRTVTGDIGVLIPSTVLDEIIQGIDKAYGRLYAKVHKYNVLGGLKVPKGKFAATWSWMTEESTGASPSGRQNGVASMGSVTFGYHLGEVRVATSLLAATVAMPIFERELGRLVTKTFLKAMDTGIMLGTGSGQPEGIITAADAGSLPSGHIIQMESSEVADWTKWQSLVFAKLPIGFRDRDYEFVFTAGTWEGNIKTLETTTGYPVYQEVYSPVDGRDRVTLKGHEVTLIEGDLGIGSFDDIDLTGSDSPYFGMIWIPDEAYGLNFNREFSVRRYLDEEKNEWVTKALAIVDGKVMDGECVYLLKKKADSSSSSSSSSRVDDDPDEGTNADGE